MMMKSRTAPIGSAGVALALAAATLALVVLWAHPGPAAAAPANDDFADTTIITSLTFIEAMSTAGATVETGEAVPPCINFPKTGFGGTVWYRISTTSATLPFTLLTATTSGSSYDTFITVWRRVNDTVLAQLGCVDDIPGGSGVILQAEIDFTVDPDKIYFIQVGGTTPGTPTGDLSFGLSGAATLAQPPVANDFADSTVKNTLLPITLTGADLDGCAGSYTYEIVSQPANGAASPSGGSASCSGPGDLSAIVFYTPNTGFGGIDPFTFRFHDGTHILDSNTATVTVTVINNPPVANSVDIGNVDGNSTNNPWTPVVSDPNSDPLTCIISTPAVNGTATVASNCSSGTYTPDTGIDGPDLFSYEVSDGDLTDTATVSVTVDPVVTVLIGDANCDGFVNTVDGLLILQADVALRDIADTCADPFTPTSPIFRAGADANCDNVINTIDALLVLQFDVGLLTELCP